MLLMMGFFLGVALYYAAVYGLFFRQFSPPAKNLFALLSAITILLIILSLRSESAPTAFLRYLLDLHNEKNPGAIFSSTMLMLIVLVTLYNTLATRPASWLARIYGLILAGFCFIMSADEYFMLHEQHAGALNWDILYTGAGIFLVLGAAVLIALARNDRRQMWLYGAVLTGIALIGLGGTIYDEFFDRGLFNYLSEPTLHTLHTVEEFLEMSGTMLLLTGAFSIATVYSPVRLRRKVLPGIVALGISWAVFLFLWQWVLPTVERNTLASPVSVSFLDGDLELTGYRVTDKPLTPGDALSLTLYWRVNTPIERRYGFTAHLLTKPDARSLASTTYLPNHNLEEMLETNQWPAGVTQRHVLHLTVPPDLDDPHSLWVMTSVFEWKGGDQTEYEMEPIAAADRPQLSPIAVLLDNVAVLPDAPPETPPTPTAVTFANGMQLTGYALPDALAGDTVTLSYWWETEQAITQDFVQILHIHHSNEEDIYVFDGPPFAGHFPTQDWPEGIRVRDEQTITLPAAIPAGTCTIVTGWYDAATQERLPIVASADQAVANDTVILGTVPCGQ